MAGREGDLPHWHARITPIEGVVHGDGTAEVVSNVFVEGVAWAAVEEGKEALRELGFEAHPASDHNTSSGRTTSSSHYFSSAHWDENAWQPGRPKNNWGYQPPVNEFPQN